MSPRLLLVMLASVSIIFGLGGVMPEGQVPVAHAGVGQPIRLSTSNGHYFDFRGTPTVLVSSAEHYGAVMNPDFNYITYLNELQAKGLNKTRIFSGEFTAGVPAFGYDDTLLPAPGRLLAPWARSSTPGYSLGGNKFDLNAWDTAYFNRLKDFVNQAGARGIVVEVSLFCAKYGDSDWTNSPMYTANNINGIGNVTAANALTLNNGNLLSAQDAMVTKIVTELQNLDNVYYEVVNEPYASNYGASDAFQNHIVSTIVNTEAGFTYKHLIAQNIANGNATITSPNGNVSIFNFHYASPPDAPVTNYGLNKAIAFDETGFQGTADTPYREDGWDFLVGGGAVYDNLDFSFTPTHPDGTWAIPGGSCCGGSPTLRSQLKILKDFINGFNFLSMAPNNSVITGGVPSGATARALVQSGWQYAIYLRGGSSASLVVNLPAGSYDAKWVDTKTGGIAKSESFTHGGGNRTLVSPSYTDDIALSIKSTGPPPPPAGFVKGIDLGGPAVTIEGNSWLSYSSALSAGLSVSNATTWSGTYGFTPNPAPTADELAMLQSGLYRGSPPAGSGFSLSQTLANGSYQVYFWTIENYQSNYRNTDIKLEGTTVATAIGDLPYGTWSKYGPYSVTVSDGVLNIDVLKNSKGDPWITGLAIYSTSAPTWTRVDNLDSSVAYSGTWNTFTNSNCYHGDTKYSGVSGNSVTYTFTGTGARWITEYGIDHGKADVYVDNVLKVSALDTYDAGGLFQQQGYEITGLASGTHTLKIVVTGAKNPSSSGYYQSADAFEYLH
jgi:hypothetical protein